MLTKPVYLEIDKPNYVPIYTVQYDYNSRFYEITILNNSQPLDLTGIRVIVAGKKPDGKEVFNSCKVLDAKKGLIQLELTEQMNAVNGASEYALELFSADGMLSSQPFKLIVTRSTISKSVESSKELGALKDALNEVQDIDNRFAQTNAQLSELANKGTTVEVLERVTKEEIERQIANGTMANLTIADGSITKEKLSPDIDLGVKDGSVTPEKTDFIHKFNALNNEGSKQGFKIQTSGGFGYVEDDEYLVTDFIEITDINALIRFRTYERIATFNENKTYTSAFGIYGQENLNSTLNIGSTYPSLNKTKYLKIAFKRKYLDDYYIQQNDIDLLASGTTLTFPMLSLESEQIPNKSIDNNKLADRSISYSKTDFIKEVNVLNNENSKQGFKIQTSGGFGYVEDDEYLVTDFIEITDLNTPIKFASYNRIAFFDESKKYFNAMGGYSSDNIGSSLTISNTSALLKTRYIKFSMKSEYLDGFYLTQGNVNLLEQGYTVHMDDFSLNRNQMNQITKEITSKISSSETVVFEKNNDFESTHFRIPFMCVTNQGTIIAGCDIRYNTWNDHSLIDIGTARSEDGGKTWIDKTVAIKNPGVSGTLSRVMDGTILATKEGRIFLIGNKFNDGNTGWTQVNTPNDPNWDCVLYHSDDDGRTWQFNQSLKSLLPSGQISFLGGVGSGIQMKNGTLVFPIQMARANDNPYNCQSGIIYSADNGVTWNICESLVPEYTSECSVVEYPTNTIMINCRQEGQNHRSVFSTTDLGATWVETPMNSGTRQTNPCQGHMCKVKVGFDTEVILFTNPVNDGTNRENGAYQGYDRSNLSLSVLLKDEVFKPIATLYRPHSDGYSCMAFDERRNRLYVVMELEYNLVFKDITDLLPTVQMYKTMENSL